MVPEKNPMDDDLLWPVKLGEKVHKPTFIEVRGKVVKFMPDNRMHDSAVSLRTNTRENAEVAINIQLVQNNTGRVLHEKTFRKISSLGTKTFSIGKISSAGMNESYGLSSMNSALNSLKIEVSKFISQKIDNLPLEGEIISTKRKEIAKKKW